jgi:DNA ligase (NAD+)
MNKIEIKNRIDFLIDEINKHDQLYYQEAQPVISDKEYDLLFAELKKLEQENPEFLEQESPTQKVSGKPIDGFETISHKRPMLSLANTYSIEEIIDFDKRVKKQLEHENYHYTTELKYDGVAISLHYQNGELALALTRGDGTKGDNIIQNIKTIKSIPIKVKEVEVGGVLLDEFEVRGECFMNTADFEKLNQTRAEKGLQLYANPRNTTAGTLKQLDSSEVAKRPLQATFYYLISDKVGLKSQFGNYDIMKKLGFQVSEFTEKHKDIDSIQKFIDTWDKKRSELEFAIDGIVIKVDEVPLQEELGTIARSPRWAVAYKFETETVETKLNAITLQIGRQGTITPVAELEPVLLSGTTVKRASLYNEDYINEKDIRVGDYVMIEKGGEIIPKVTRVVLEKRPENSMKFEFPEEVDGHKIFRKEGEANYYIDDTANHPLIVKKRIEHFASRNAMDIDTLGEKVVSDFVDKGLLKDIKDIYYLKDFGEQIKSYEGWGEKSVQRLIDAIEESKEQDFVKVLYGLGIRHLGEGSAKLIVKYFDNIDKLLKATKEELVAIHEIGEKIAESIFNWFNSPENIRLIDELKAVGLNFQKAEEEESSDKLLGKTFVFTGELERMGRKEAAKIVEKLGGRETKSVSKSTSYLVVGDSPGSKFDKAKKLGIKILNEEDFFNLIKKV